MKNFRHMFQPSKEFKKRAKIVFLSAFQEKFPKNLWHVSGFTYFVRRTAFGIALMAILGSVSVYADQTNVGPDHPLYSLKRSHETVSLFLAGEGEQPSLHLKYAVRRLAEVQKIREKDPEGKAILSLVHELREEVKNSLTTLGSNGETEGDEEEDGFSREEEGEETEDTKGSAQIPKREFERNEDEDENENKGISFTPPAASTTVMPVTGASSSEEEKDKSKGSIKEPVRKTGERRDQRKKQENTSDQKKSLLICESWGDLIGSREEGISEVMKAHPEFLKRFENKCRPLLKEPASP